MPTKRKMRVGNLIAIASDKSKKPIGIVSRTASMGNIHLVVVKRYNGDTSSYVESDVIKLKKTVKDINKYYQKNV